MDTAGFRKRWAGENIALVTFVTMWALIPYNEDKNDLLLKGRHVCKYEQNLHTNNTEFRVPSPP